MKNSKPKGKIGWKRDRIFVSKEEHEEKYEKKRKRPYKKYKKKDDKI